MSAFMIICLPERGGYYPTFAVARALQAEGHQVIYPGMRDFREDVERQGFTFVTLFPDTPSLDPNVGEIPESLIKKLLYFRKRAIENPRRFQILEAIANGDIAALIRQHQVDVVLLDAFLSQFAPACLEAEVRVVSMATELINYRNHGIPPNYSPHIPTTGLWSRLVCRTLWLKLLLLIYVRRALMFVVLKMLFWPAPPRALQRQARALTRKARLKSMLSEYSWRFVLPEFVLCPAAFDFPAASANGSRRYLGVTIDRARVDVPFEHEIPPDKQLIYVSLGTHAAMYGRKVERIIRQVIELASRRPDWHFIVNIGKGNDPSKFGQIPENVHLTTFVPQLQILDRSAAIVTNGGLGTVKEAIMAEVPLLVVPCRWDQFGNAARVKYHGLGETCNINRVTSVELEQWLDKLLNNQVYRRRLAAIKQEIVAADEFTAGVAWLASLPQEFAHSR